MSVIVFQDHELPEALCQIVRRLSLKDVGLYNGQKHKFSPPILDPSENAIRRIKVEYEKYNSLQDINLNVLVNYVNHNTTVDPIIQSVQSVHVGVGDETVLKKLQHLVLVEDNNAETDLLYLDKNKFFVLRTSRSTILSGDILHANTLPINIGEQVRFSVFRNGKEFVPEKFAQYETSFQTQSIIQIKLYNSPELYKIIDDDERYGDCVVSNDNKQQIDKSLQSLIKEVNKVFASLDEDYLSAYEKFPKYEMLLGLAKKKGIDCYTLNLLIECNDRLRFYKPEYKLEDKDWYYVLTEGDKERIRAQRELENSKNYNEKFTKFKDEISKIRSRRVMLFFKAAGRISDMSYISQLESELDSLAEVGYGIKGEAKQMRLDAIANSKPKNGENLLTAAKLFAVIALIVTVGWIWFTSNRNMEIFNYKIEDADRILAEGKYLEAREAYRLAYEEYRPKITAMLAQTKMNKRVRMLEDALNEEIETGVNQIMTMRMADGGKFSKASEDLMFRLLELAPNDERLINLKEQWKNQ